MSHHPTQDPQFRAGGSTYRAREREYASSEDELSDGEGLSDGDLNVLNTDYALQRDFTFYPSHQQHHPHPNHPPISGLHQPSHPLHHVPSPSEKDFYSEYPPNSPTTLIRDSSIPNGRANAAYRNAHAYQHSARKRRPLIDYIKNEWQKSAFPSASSSPTSPRRFSPPRWFRVCFAPRFQRSIIAFILLFLLIWGNWKTWASRKFDEERGLRSSSKLRMDKIDGLFGQNLRPDFLSMTQIESLDENLVPGAAGTGTQNRRLLVIGDVHGCQDELSALLNEANFDSTTDHLIFSGDMISKGPSSTSVVDFAMSAEASCVRGNHEDRVLLTARDYMIHESIGKKKAKPPKPGIPEEASKPEDVTLEDEPEELTRLEAADRLLAQQLSKRQLEYLGKCPVIIDIGEVPGMGRAQVVHAGLIPGVVLESQDPINAMQMRTVDLETHVPSSKGQGTPWFKLWNKYQSLLPAKERSTVIYGHDSKRGLQLESYSKGIDTGCFSGGKLSALVIDGNSSSEPKLVSVDCKDYRGLEKETIKKAGKKMP